MEGRRKITVILLLLLTLILAGVSVYVAIRLRQDQAPDDGSAAVNEGYTNCCGYASGQCPQNGSGSTCGRGCVGTTCSGVAVFKYVCDGRVGECRSNESGPTSSASVSGTSCGKTVQLDVFNKNCRDGGAGSWSCTNSNLLDFIVYYTGDCDTPPPPPPPTEVQCGQACGANTVCVSGTTCSNGICTLNACVNNPACQLGPCTPPPTVVACGQPCNTGNVTCDTGYLCYNGTCIDPRCQYDNCTDVCNPPETESYCGDAVCDPGETCEVVEKLGTGTNYTQKRCTSVGGPPTGGELYSPNLCRNVTADPNATKTPGVDCTFCGDGIVNGPEQCDWLATPNTCNSNCTLKLTVGTPIANPVCVSGTSSVTVTWDNSQGKATTGYNVIVDTDTNTSNGFWLRQINNIATTSVTLPGGTMSGANGFSPLTSFTAGQVYNVTIYYLAGSQYETSATVQFTAISCTVPQVTCYRCTAATNDGNLCESQVYNNTTTCPTGWSTNSNCAQAAGGNCPMQTTCYRCTAVTNDGNTCESQILNGSNCSTLGVGWTNNSACQTAAPGGVCAVQTTCYRCTAATNDGNTCENQVISGTNCSSLGAGWTSNSACETAATGGVCLVQTTCYRCTAATNDGNTCENQVINGTNCSSLGAGWTNNSSCQTAAPGGVCAVQTTCYRCTPNSADGDTCENQVITGTDCVAALGTGWSTNSDCAANAGGACPVQTTCFRCTTATTDSPTACEEQTITGADCVAELGAGWNTNSNCAQDAGGVCPYTQPICGESCPFGTCSTGNTCQSGVCVLDECATNPELCASNLCEAANPVCGEACQSGFADCGVGYTCNAGTCELDECVTSPESCQPGMCALQNDLCGDPCDPNGAETCPNGHTCEPDAGDPNTGTCALDTCLVNPELCNDDLCTFNQPQCGEACLPGVVPCPNGQTCDADTNTCILTICETQNCGSNKCSQPPLVTCGQSCTSTSQCPNGHVCSNGSCKLSQCVSGSANCSSNGCALLPNTAIGDDSKDYLMIGIVLILTSLIFYRIRLGTALVSLINVRFNSSEIGTSRFDHQRKRFEKRFSKSRK